MSAVACTVHLCGRPFLPDQAEVGARKRHDSSGSDSDGAAGGGAGSGPLKAGDGPPDFGKYERMGAYHWAAADPGSADYAPATEARYELIVEQVAGSGRVLDIGCGDGYLVGRAAAQSDLVVGIEPEPTGAALARDLLRGWPGCHVALGSGSALPLSRHAFDAVTLADVIEHLEDPHACLAEAARVLRPGGKIAVTTPRRLHDHWWDEANHVVEYSSAELRDLLARHFVDVEVSHFLSLRWWKLRKWLGKGFIQTWSRLLFNPFRSEGPEPEGYGHLLATGRVAS